MHVVVLSNHVVFASALCPSCITERLESTICNACRRCSCMQPCQVSIVECRATECARVHGP